MQKSGLQKQFCDGDRRCTGTGDYDLYIFFLLFYKFQCILDSCQRDDSSSVLVVMKDRDITAFFQLSFNLETPGCGNVFQIDSPEGTRNQCDCVYKFVHILAFHTEGKGIHAAECFKQYAFSFHHRHAGFRADVS